MDWLSHLLTMMPVSGQLELRCHYGAPWRVAYEVSTAGEMPYHVIVGGSAVLDDRDGGPPQHLRVGDILLVPHGGAHVLHDGSGKRPNKANDRDGLNFIISENAGTGARLDMLCGRFILAPSHSRLLLSYLPPRLIVRTARSDSTTRPAATGAQLTALMELMRAEAAVESLGDRPCSMRFQLLFSR